VLVVVIDIMPVNDNTAVAAAAKPLANRRAARAGGGVDVGANVGRGQGTGDRPGEILWNEDQVPLGVGRHRMRAGRLRDGFDQDTRDVDDTQHRTRTERGAGWRNCFAGAQIVAIITLVEPDLVGASDPVHTGLILGLGVDDERGRAPRQVTGGAAQQQIVKICRRGAIRPALMSLTTPVFVAGSKAPSTAFGWSGSVTSRPPLQVTGGVFVLALHPGGLLAMVGTEV